MAATSPTGRSGLAQRLAAGEVVLLDGATGTELHRRGVPTTLPLWSALGLIECPDVVRAIHRDYAEAGADVVTANTFRTTRRMLERAGRDPDEAAALNGLAVALAREACAEAGRAGVLVAGSIAPLEDCYSPWLSPPFDVALAEHRDQVSLLAAAGADLLLVETMPCAAEAEAAVAAARETGLEAAVGFVCGPDLRLLGGDTLAEAVARVEPHEPVAILVNCAAPDVVGAALAELRRLTARPLGGYANAGLVDPVVGWAPDPSLTPAAYAAAAARWLDLGAQLIGGCCGTSPAVIAALRGLLDGAGGAGPSPAAHRAPRGARGASLPSPVGSPRT